MENNIVIMRSKLKADAVAQYGLGIAPVIFKKSLDECFTEHFERLYFWFNEPGNSTRVLSMPLIKGETVCPNSNQ